jgi:subfamily B ATP-binding cassette protein MsbA
MKYELETIFKRYSSGRIADDFIILWHLSRPYWGRLAVAGLCSIIISGVDGAIAWSVKPATDHIFIGRQSEYLYLLPLGVFALFSMRGLFTVFNNYLMASIGGKIVRELRQKVYEKLLALPMSYHLRNSSGDTVSKMLNDVSVLQGTVGFTVKDIFVEAGAVIVLAGVAISRKWDLALVSFVVVPLIAYSIAKLGSRMQKTSAKTRLLLAKISTIINESLQGIKVIKAFTMEEKIKTLNKQILAEYYRNTMRETRINEFSSFNADIISGLGVAVIIFYGGSLVITGQMSTGDFASFVAAIFLMYTPLRRLSRVHNNFQQGRTALDRVREVIAVKPEKQDGEEIEVKGEVVFDKVCFRYPEAQTDALSNVDLNIRRGEILALVGYSGGGKSTLVDLVAGFWYPTSGAIYVDGRDITTLSLHSLRSHIGAVTQDVILFDDSVRENIRFGRPEATDEEVIEAAKAAFAHDFIMEMPDGYNTMIGERGVRLSGGQKQRITIARAIIRNPSILILDEATSSLDTESEHQVQNALERLMQNRTTIVIAHRLSTIQKASRIAVLSGGCVIQEGTHEELLTRGGLYQELYNMQFMRSGDDEAGKAPAAS